jgi:hypothetical protein
MSAKVHRDSPLFSCIISTTSHGKNNAVSICGCFAHLRRPRHAAAPPSSPWRTTTTFRSRASHPLCTDTIEITAGTATVPREQAHSVAAS